MFAVKPTSYVSVWGPILDFSGIFFIIEISKAMSVLWFILLKQCFPVPLMWTDAKLFGALSNDLPLLLTPWIPLFKVQKTSPDLTTELAVSYRPLAVSYWLFRGCLARLGSWFHRLSVYTAFHPWFSLPPDCFQQHSVSSFLQKLQYAFVLQFSEFFTRLPHSFSSKICEGKGANLLLVTTPMIFYLFHVMCQHPLILSGYVPRHQEMMSGIQSCQTLYILFPLCAPKRKFNL